MPRVVFSSKHACWGQVMPKVSIVQVNLEPVELWCEKNEKGKKK